MRTLQTIIGDIKKKLVQNWYFIMPFVVVFIAITAIAFTVRANPENLNNERSSEMSRYYTSENLSNHSIQGIIQRSVLQTIQYPGMKGRSYDFTKNNTGNLSDHTNKIPDGLSGDQDDSDLIVQNAIAHSLNLHKYYLFQRKNDIYKSLNSSVQNSFSSENLH